MTVAGTGTTHATSTGPGAISYTTASPDCTINASSGLVTGVHAGTDNCVLTATAAATTDYTTGSTTQTLSIGLGGQSVTFDPAP